MLQDDTASPVPDYKMNENNVLRNAGCYRIVTLKDENNRKRSEHGENREEFSMLPNRNAMLLNGSRLQGTFRHESCSEDPDPDPDPDLNQEKKERKIKRRGDKRGLGRKGEMWITCA